MKLKLDSLVEVKFDEENLLTSIISLIPYPLGRAVLFGWIYCGPYKHESYWLGEIDNGKFTYRILEDELTNRLVELTQRPNDSGGSYTKVRAFRIGNDVGLLIGSKEIWIYSSTSDNPTKILIKNHFSELGRPRHKTSVHDSHYVPIQCGYTNGNVVPVILSSPDWSHGQSIHACLLNIDLESGEGKWLNTNSDGKPFGITFDDYAEFIKPEAIRSAYMTDGKITYHPPMIMDCSLNGEFINLYIGGYSNAHHKFGLPLSLISENLQNNKLNRMLFRANEQSFGRICASGNLLILTPLRKNDPSKGKQSIVNFKTGEPMHLIPPKGLTKFFMLDHYDGNYWLSKDQWGYGISKIAICSEA